MAQMKDRYQLPIESLPDAFAYHRIILDSQGSPVDYIFLEVNDVFEDMTGLQREDVIGRKVTKVLPGIEESGYNWIEIYGRVALKGESTRFEDYSKPLERWYEVTAYSDRTGYFATIFNDITRRKEEEKKLREGVEKYLSEKNTEKDLQGQKELLEGVINGIKDVIGIQYPDHTIERYNQAGYEMLGMNPQEVKGRKCYELIGREEECVPCPTRKALETKELVAMEKYIEETGTYLSCSSNPVLDEGGNVVRIIEQLRDVTEQKKQKERIREERDYMFRIFDSMKQYVIVDSADYRIEFLNRAAREDFGKLEGKICYKQLGRNAPCPQCPVPLIIGENHPGPLEYTVEAFGRILEGSATPLVNLDGSISVLEVLEDVTGRKKAVEKIIHLSFYDSLTGLFNRTYYEEELERLQKRGEYPITIITADVDGLKFVNDTMGHSRGDDLLKACAEVLKESCRDSDILARLGGDEFVLLLSQTGEGEGEKVISRIRSNVEEHNKTYYELPLSLSLGMATAENRGEPLEETYKKADNLMCRAKLHKEQGTRPQIINTLMAALEERDYITEGHAQRLSLLCRQVGERVGLSTRQLDDLALLSRVHDLGKVGTPDSILLKEGPLTQEEWRIMKQHPEIGYRIALASPDLSGIADLILKHHERWEGTGYPLGLKKEEIPVECRILAVVDAFDAMTSDRPYRKARTFEEAVEEVKRCAGTQFDPYLVHVFLKVLSVG